MAPSIPALAAELQGGVTGPGFDGVIHAGDYAYVFGLWGFSLFFSPVFFSRFHSHTAEYSDV